MSSIVSCKSVGRVGLSNTLLLVVVLCIVAKASKCVFVLVKIRDDPLVTPGDAIASYLTSPDPKTLDCSGMSMQQFLAPPSSLAGKGQGLSFTPGPREWKKIARHSYGAIPRSVLIRTYSLLLLTISATIALVGIALHEQPLSSR